jgi:hypothetical protein
MHVDGDVDVNVDVTRTDLEHHRYPDAPHPLRPRSFDLDSNPLRSLFLDHSREVEHAISRWFQVVGVVSR